MALPNPVGASQASFLPYEHKAAFGALVTSVALYIHPFAGAGIAAFSLTYIVTQIAGNQLFQWDGDQMLKRTARAVTSCFAGFVACFATMAVLGSTISTTPSFVATCTGIGVVVTLLDIAQLT